LIPRDHDALREVTDGALRQDEHGATSVQQRGEQKRTSSAAALWFWPRHDREVRYRPCNGERSCRRSDEVVPYGPLSLPRGEAPS
jgi:hypothetical protein